LTDGPDGFAREGVLYVSYDGVLEPIGQSQILPYLEGLRAQGVPVALLTWEKADDLVPASPTLASTRGRLAAHGIPWTALRYHKRPPLLSTVGDWARGLVWIRRLARQHRLALLHARSYVPAAMAWPLRRRLGAALVFDIRGFWVDERVEGGIWRRGLAYRLARRVEGRLFGASDAVVVLTEPAAAVVRQRPEVHGRRVPVVVVPTCVDTERFAPRDPDARCAARLGNPGGPVLAYVGSAGTWAGMEAVLEFFATAVEEWKAASLLLVVRGAVDEVRAAVARRGLSEAATVVPDVSHGELPAWLSVARAGLALYRPGWSNVARFPTKIGEYLASGLPVVVSSGVGDCERFVEDHGVGVCLRTLSPAEHRRAARALRALLADPAVALRCRAVAERELSVAEGVRRYAALYDDLGVVGRAASLSLPGSR
jgi:glycosyltransferase involved in cell wall biosynthesis